MPKPLFLVRSSGLYVRFLVPTDLRPIVGTRFLVRSLRGLRSDAARLAAAEVAMALSNAFTAFRGGLVSSDEFQRGIRTFTIESMKVGNTTLSGIQVKDDADAARFNKFVQNLKDKTPASSIDEAKRRRYLTTGNKKYFLKLSEAIDEHLKDLISANLHSKTIYESRHTLRILNGIIGDVGISVIDVNCVRAFFEAVRCWPHNATQKAEYKELSVKQIVKLAKENNEPEISQATINKHWSRLSVFFVFLRKQAYIDSDPLAGLAKPKVKTLKKTGGRPFNKEEIDIIFGPDFEAWAYKWPHRFWGVMLGYYSGARVNEIAQLRPDEIISVNEVLGFVITEEIEDNSTKNVNSQRFVPIAKPVLDAGFLAYVEEVKKFGFERLFPNLPNADGKLSFGRQVSRQFSAYIKGHGIDEAGLGFHGFRHHFITYTDRALADAGIDDSLRDPMIGRITGHYKAPNSTLRKVYVDNKGLHVPAFIEPETLEQRVLTLQRFVDNNSITYPAYKPRQFEQAFFKAAEDEAKLKKHKEARSKLKTQKAKERAKAKGE